jgi:hypothetical protein
MKILKTFDNIYSKFEVDDIVKINTKNSDFSNSEFYHNKIGRISYKFKTSYTYKVVLDDNPNDYKAAIFNYFELDYASPEEIEQYKIEKDINKYNL